MSSQKAVERLIHDLKYDEEYADLSGYIKDLELLVKENKNLRENDDSTALKRELFKSQQSYKALKKSYAQTANKLKRIHTHYKAALKELGKTEV
ncbi:hypothetical protein ACEPPU_24265 [Priestia aryabhattai]|uniref:hypothetical protein n=1 Tax=Priestia aryabhattai TaxID=412384 RepID=UPI0035ABA078